jgi:hypothetical protein
VKKLIAVIAIVTACFITQARVLGEDNSASQENQKLQLDNQKLREENNQLRAMIDALRHNQVGLNDEVVRLGKQVNELQSQLARVPRPAEPTSQPTTAETPILGANATISGRTIQVTMGVPGGMMGKPGKPIPPHPVGASMVRFSGGGKDYEVMSGKDGTYKVALPPGVYKVHFKAPGQPDWQPRNESDVKTVEVKNSDNLKLDIPVLTLAVD